MSVDGRVLSGTARRDRGQRTAPEGRGRSGWETARSVWMILTACASAALIYRVVAQGLHAWRSRPVGAQPPGVQWRFGWLPALGTFAPALAGAKFAAIAAWLFRRWRTRSLGSPSRSARFVVAAVVGGLAIAGAALAIGVVIHRPAAGAEGYQRDLAQVLLAGVGISVIALAGWTLTRPALRANLATALLAGATICVAAGALLLARHAQPAHGATTAWTAAGGYWETRDIIRPDGALGYNAISCPTPTACITLGDGVDSTLDTVTSTDGGSTWTAVPPATPVPVAAGTPGGFLAGVACIDQRHCVAADTQLLVTRDGGYHWRTAAVPVGYTAWAVACTTTATCVAAGSDLTAEPSPGSYVPPTPAVLVSVDGGATWSAGQLPPGMWRLAATACVSTTMCFAAGWDQARPSVGGVIFETRTGGTTWTRVATNFTLPVLNRIVCPDDNHCVALGHTGTQGIAVTTADGGNTWSTRTIQAISNLNAQIACTSTARCLIADNTSNGINVVATDDGGQTWRFVTTVANLDAFYPGPALSCPNPHTCLLGATTSNGGHGVILSGDPTGTNWQPVHTAAP